MSAPRLRVRPFRMETALNASASIRGQNYAVETVADALWAFQHELERYNCVLKIKLLGIHINRHVRICTRTHNGRQTERPIRRAHTRNCIVNGVYGPRMHTCMYNLSDQTAMSDFL